MIKPPYLKEDKKNGKFYYTYRRAGCRQKVEGEPGSIEFLTNYTRIHESFESAPRQKGVQPGTFNALTKRFFESAEYRTLGNRAKQEYSYYLGLWCAKNGDKPYSALTRGALMAVRDKGYESPSRTNHLIKSVRRLLQYAVSRDLLVVNVASQIKPLTEGDGWEAWPKDALDNADANLEGSARVAYFLARYTGQRKGDVLKMKWSDIEDGAISVKQSKTGLRLWVPIHPILADELKEIDRKGLAIVARRDGGPFTESGFNKIWQTQQRRLNLRGNQFHGLRRNAVNGLLEAGCEIPEVSSITGQSFEMVQHYAQQVNRTRLAKSADTNDDCAGSDGGQSGRCPDFRAQRVQGRRGFGRAVVDRWSGIPDVGQPLSQF
jgi:integrase